MVICFCVQTLDGKQLDWHVAQAFTDILEVEQQLGELQFHIEKTWGVPVLLQKLFCNGHADVCQEVWQACSGTTQEFTISMVLIVSDEYVCTLLKGKCSEQECVEGLTAITQVLANAKGNQRTIDAICENMGRWSCVTKLAAVQTLIQIVECSDDGMVETLTSMLNYKPGYSNWARERWYLERTVLEALGHFAEGPKDDVITKISTYLSVEDFGVSSSAVIALVRLANRGKRSATCVQKVLLSRLLDSNSHAQSKVIEAFPRVAEKGDTCAIGLILECVSAEEAQVRRAALVMLGSVIEIVDRAVVSVLISHAKEDADDLVRSEAIKTLGQCTGVDDEDVMIQLRASLEDVSEKVRVEALWALKRLVHANDKRSLDAVCTCTSDTSPKVRFAALHAIFGMALKCDSEGALMSALKRCLVDQTAHVRYAAIGVLSKMHVSRPDAVNEVLDGLEEYADSRVRRVVESARLRISHETSEN